MPTAMKAPPKIVEIGVEHWASGTGNIKAFILGGPDVGKTRWSSAFPRPLYLACESIETVAASIATRKIDYPEGLRPPRVVDIRSTQDMINTITQLEKVSRTAPPGQQPTYRTAVVDTLDGFSRTVKDEWSAAQEDGIFTGRDAWSYLEAKMGLVLTRLLALDMNVVVLCHLKEKTVGEGENKVISYEPFLQGQTKDTIFHDFNLVGLMQFEWAPGDQQGERDRRRGITYEPTPTFPFLKDHFHLPTPEYRINNRKHWPVTLDDGTKDGTSNPQEFNDTNYGNLAAAIIEGLDGLGDSIEIEQIPDSTGPSPEGVTPPGRGGPVAGAPATPPPAKKTAAAKTTPAKQTAAAKTTAPAAPPAQTPVASSDGAVAVGPADPAPEPAAQAEVTTAGPQTPVAEQTTGADSAPEQTAEPTLDEAVTTAEQTLGAEVVTDATPVEETSAGTGCPVCGKDLSTESADLVQLSRLKHREVVVADGRNLYDANGCCFECYQKLNNEKATQTGHYAQTA